MSNKRRLYTVYYISVNCSTCFGWLIHPSSEALITVIAASGTGQTVSATFRCRGADGMAVPTSPVGMAVPTSPVGMAVPISPRQREVAETV